ncbi:MAG TPA: hemerythrin domain-containing protein [Bryobacteraceae bacterium]|nr:hemerythrin domain-containing protein [Bryobacteraceae bacterium]
MLRHKSLHPLSHQHHNGLALGVMVRRALEADASAASAARQSARVLDRFDLEIVNHFALEEVLLFPAIEAELGPHDLVRTLIAEHRRLETLAARLREAPEDVSTLLEFIELLRIHIRTEENQLFEEVQGRLSAGTLTRLGAEFEARAVRICIEP